MIRFIGSMLALIVILFIFRPDALVQSTAPTSVPAPPVVQQMPDDGSCTYDQPRRFCNV